MILIIEMKINITKIIFKKKLYLMKKKLYLMKKNIYLMKKNIYLMKKKKNKKMKVFNFI